jgi:two-component system response regulator PilR (NtrC family)
VIESEALSPAVLNPPALSTESRIPVDGADLEGMLASYERGLLTEALQRSGGIKKRAAQLLGVSFRSFRYRLEKLGLDESPAGEP